jgi:hypothetical protein
LKDIQKEKNKIKESNFQIRKIEKSSFLKKIQYEKIVLKKSHKNVIFKKNKIFFIEDIIF